MPRARVGRTNGLWSDFQGTFLGATGISIQAFDEKGVALQPAPPLPPLCAYFQRFPETQAACQKGCFGKARELRNSRKILPARCHAGLSYRIVPVRRRKRPHGAILVGRVLTEVFGGEQCLGFIERYKLSREAFLENLAGLRTIGGADLDRVAAFVRRASCSLTASGVRMNHRASMIQRREDLLAVARQATAFHDTDPGQAGALLRSLGKVLGASGVAILLVGDDPSRLVVHASLGLGEETLHALARQDWPRSIAERGNGARMVFSDRRQLLPAGLDCAELPLVVQRLSQGARSVGYLAASGASLGASRPELLAATSDFVAARMVHLKCRERAEQRDEEARLLVTMAEQCLTAHSVEELLPLALEAAMCALRARRGSILLAEEHGQITARALRGDHAPISSTIEELRPDSVSHKVFFNRRSLLVRDTGREPGLAQARQFPYVSRSFMSVPLRENGGALGVLHLTERDGAAAFTPSDLALLERLGLQASAAIGRARLAEEVQSLRVASCTDHLTGVHNRRYLDERLAIELQRARRFGQPLAVAMLDIDSFKHLNDALGHRHGDRVLKLVADTVRRQLRSVDVLARYGGDEFVLVLPGTDAKGASTMVEKIRSLIESAELPDGPSSAPLRNFTVSVGLSAYPGTAVAAEELLEEADQSLLQAKVAGGNAVVLPKGSRSAQGRAAPFPSRLNG